MKRTEKAERAEKADRAYAERRKGAEPLASKGSGAAGEEAVKDAADAIRGKLRGRLPKIAIVLGSGLGGLTERFSDAVRIPYREIPGFPDTTVVGHGGELVCGRLAGKEVLAQSGRFHLYEGHDVATAALPIRAFGTLGVETLLLTNAAGGIRRSFSSGALMLIADHINLTFRNPLIGRVVPGEDRFPDMSQPYEERLRTLAHTVARERRVALQDGVYVQLLGPSFETPAEIRMLERLGADAVGMSTVVEVIAARARRLRCLGISVVTNLASGLSPGKLSHEEVMETANRMRGELGALVEGIIEKL